MDYLWIPELKRKGWKKGDKICNTESGKHEIFLQDKFVAGYGRVWINLSLRGRKAHATFMKTHTRGAKGRFESNRLTDFLTNYLETELNLDPDVARIHAVKLSKWMEKEFEQRSVFLFGKGIGKDEEWPESGTLED